jgi:replicative DNA helicase
MNEERFALSLQQDLISLICHSDDHGKVISKIVEPKYFEGDYKIIADRALDFWKQHNKAPKQHIADLLSDILEDPKDRRAQTYRRILVQMIEVVDQINVDFVLRSMNQFIWVQKTKAIILQSAEQLDARGVHAREDVETLFRDLLKDNNTNLDAGIRLNEIDKVLEYFSNVHSEFKTGIKEFDEANIVPMRGKLWLLMAAAKRGKCVAEGEHVLLSDGRYIPIELLKDGDMVPSFDEHQKLFIPKKAYLSENGSKNVFSVTTRSGRSILLTSEHRLLTESGWKPLSEISIGEHIAVPAECEVFGCAELPKSTLRILGYLIADGGLTNTSSPTFTKQDPVIVSDMSDCLADFGCKLRQDRFDPITYYIIRSDKTHWRNKISLMLAEFGLSGKKSIHKEIPQQIFSLRKDLVAEFLRALFSCDGSVYKSGFSWTFEYGTSSEKMAKQIHHLLSRFGIVSRLAMGTQIVSGRPYKSWSITIMSQAQLLKLNERIGLLSKKGVLLNQATSGNYNPKNNRTGIDRKVFGMLLFDKVLRIEPAGLKKTYDLMVEDTHNFIAENILVHNTWALVQIGKMAFLQRKKVLHISLEIEAEEVVQRYYQALFGVSKRDEMNKVSSFRFDRQGELDQVVSNTVEAPFTFNSFAIKEELQTRINRFGMRSSNFIVKRFPMSSLTLDQLEAYLESLEALEEFVPDLVILDYPKIMKLNQKEIRTSLGQLMEGLRGLAQRRNFALAAVHQGNRSSSEASIVKATHASEDWSVVCTADFLITFSQTPAEKQRGLARLYVEMARSEQDAFGVLITQSYRTGQFVLESTRLSDSYARLMEAMGTGEDADDSDDQE